MGEEDGSGKAKAISAPLALAVHLKSDFSHVGPVLSDSHWFMGRMGLFVSEGVSIVGYIA